MPVLLTGADNPVGAAAVRLLAAQGGEVRVFLPVGEDAARDEALVAQLRGMRCKVAHGHMDDEAHVETALEQVHTVLHLAGRPTDDPDAHLERTATVIAAAIGAGCRRLVLLSDLLVGEHPDPSGNPWLAALAEAEEMAADAPLESVVLRCATIHGDDDPLTTAIAAGALGPDPVGAHWPVAASDVATTAVLADAERDLDTDLHVIVSVAGPRQLSTADYVRALRSRVPAGTGDPLPAHARDMLLIEVDRPADAVGGSGVALDEGDGPSAVDA